jgi:hypothetical protein
VLVGDDLPCELKVAKALLALEYAGCGGPCDELMEGLKGLA